jgi:hypothetical protein
MRASPVGARPRPRVRAALALLVGAFAIAQVVRRPGLTNPPSEPARAISAHVPVPPDVGRILRRACYDCHSHETRWPAYARVAPVSWLVARDVRVARSDLDFSDWSVDPVREPTPAQRLGGICHDVRRRIMPPRSYTLMHPAARLSPWDVARLCAWTDGARAGLPP